MTLWDLGALLPLLEARRGAVKVALERLLEDVRLS